MRVVSKSDEDQTHISSARKTSHDVARVAGVSQSTVSRVFRAPSSVSQKTRRRVEEAAAALNYIPNRIARSLILQRSGMIAVVINHASSRAYPEILFHLGEEIEAAGYRMLVFTMPPDEDGSQTINTLLSYNIDGILSGSTFGEQVFAICGDARVPIVMFNRKAYGRLASGVGCDHEGGIELLLQQIAPLVRGSVAVLAGPEGAPVSEARLRGIRNSMARFGLPIGRVLHEDYSFDGGQRAARTLFTPEGGPDLVACVNDAMALGVMDACRFELGRTVPEGVMVTGFDDIPQAAWPSYGLTSLRQPVRRMAASAIRLLSEMIEGPSGHGEMRLLAAELQLRTSTARA